MTVDLSKAAPIDSSDPQFAPMLHNLQGNILKGHGRDHTVHLFFEFQDYRAVVQPALADLAGQYVTSAAQQLHDTQQFKDFGIPGGLFGGLLLTARGYGKLGFTADQLAAAFAEAPGDLGVTSSFKAGMAAGIADLNDPLETAWEPGYQGRRIDAMLLLADDDEAFLLRQAHTALAQVSAFATVLAVEHGGALRNEAGNGIEHFGYVDGRSQPIYLASDIADEGGTDKWDPSAPLGQVLVQDRTVPDADSFGSYFVFRKLEQDVLHFKMREQDLATTLGLGDEDRERAGAMVIGRFEDGTPVVLSQTDGFRPVKDNNFQYDLDPEGMKCPFAAHIRKSNPRGDIGRQFGADPAIAERPRRMTRRGIPYGKRKFNPDAVQAIEDLPSGGVGLLFMCYGSSIANQFAFIQKNWVNAPDFVKTGVGIDPIIGEGAPTSQDWPVAWGAPATKPVGFEGFVTLKGGEYFFAPSLPFLRTLAPPMAAAAGAALPRSATAQSLPVVLSAGDPAQSGVAAPPIAAPPELVGGRKC